MHIVFLPSWYPATPRGISGSFFREQAIALAKRGVEVGVIHPQPRSLRRLSTVFVGPYGVTAEEDEGVQTYRSHGLSWFPRMPRLSRWYWIRHGIRLFEQYIEKHGMPDLVHVHSMLNAGALALELHRKYRIPYVITEHSSAFARHLLTKEQYVVARTVAHHAKGRFAVSKSFCELLMDHLGGQAGEWVEVPNIVTQAFLDHDFSGRTDKPKASRFLTVALLTENKAIDNLLRAFAKQFAGLAGVSLHIGGDGPDRPRLEALTKDLDILKQVQFLGALSRTEVSDAIADADVFVMPSHYETFGVAVIEALALGKPVIATRCGGPESIIAQGDGLLVPTNDVDALAKAMTEIVVSIDHYDALSIRERCRQRYSEDVVILRLIKLYREVIESRAC